MRSIEMKEIREKFKLKKELSKIERLKKISHSYN